MQVQFGMSVIKKTPIRKNAQIHNETSRIITKLLPFVSTYFYTQNVSGNIVLDIEGTIFIIQIVPYIVKDCGNVTGYSNILSSLYI